MDSLLYGQQNLDKPEFGKASFKDILPFPTSEKRPNAKEQKQLILDYLQAKNIKKSLGYTCSANRHVVFYSDLTSYSVVS